MSAPEAAPDVRWIDYDYAVVRVVPHVHLGTFVNIGVVLHARTSRFLDLLFSLDVGLWETLDADLLRRHLDAYRQVCHGGTEAGPIGLLPPSERFHWITAPRSAVLQTSEVRTGRTSNPEATLRHLFDVHVQAALPHSPT